MADEKSEFYPVLVTGLGETQGSPGR